MFKTREKNNKGFTLIEMIVSVALFSIVVVVAIGSILTIIDANRKSQTLTLVMNNLNFALEVMTRNIKTADPTTLSDNSAPNYVIETANGTESFRPQSPEYLELRTQDGDDIVYFFYEDLDNGIPGSIYRAPQGGGTAFPIISSEVVIEDFKAFLEDENQPRVLLLIDGYAQVTEKTRSDFTIQTTVSPRRLDIESINQIVE